MIGEAEIGDPICRRVHELPADYRGVHSCHSVIVGVAFRVRVLGGREGGREREREGRRFKNENGEREPYCLLNLNFKE